MLLRSEKTNLLSGINFLMGRRFEGFLTLAPSLTYPAELPTSKVCTITILVTIKEYSKCLKGPVINICRATKSRIVRTIYITNAD